MTVKLYQRRRHCAQGFNRESSYRRWHVLTSWVTFWVTASAINRTTASPRVGDFEFLLRYHPINDLNRLLSAPR